MNARLQNLTFIDKLIKAIEVSRGNLCVGLDPDVTRMPVPDVFEFNKNIIDATADVTAAYKLQLAFYEVQGSEGIRALEATVGYIREKAEHAFTILDGKSCDISNSAEAYASAYFDRWNFDAATVVPYTGVDGILPFVKSPERGAFVVCHTSNASASFIQDLHIRAPAGQVGKMVYQHVAEMVSDTCLNRNNNIGLVVGATYPHILAEIRGRYKDTPLLVPGIGAQGGDPIRIAEYAIGENRLTLINASRSIIYASADKRIYGEEARKACMRLREKMTLRT